MPASRATPSRRGREPSGKQQGRVDRPTRRGLNCAPAKFRPAASGPPHPTPTMGSFEETAMAGNAQRVGWIGMGRMGHPKAARPPPAGHDVAVWNRPIAKAQPLAGAGAKVVNTPAHLAGVDVLFSIVSTGKDLEQVYFGPAGALSAAGKVPAIIVDCSTIGVEESERIRAR